MDALGGSVECACVVSEYESTGAEECLVGTKGAHVGKGQMKKRNKKEIFLGRHGRMISIYKYGIIYVLLKKFR